MSLVSSASHRKLISLIRISSLSAHTSHHPINHNQTGIYNTLALPGPRNSLKHAHTHTQTCSLRRTCTGICGVTSLSFKGAMKAERFALITSTLTLNGLSFQPAVTRGAKKKKKPPKNLEPIKRKIKSHKLRTRG